MTLTEKAICELYTGICFCQGEEREAVYAYAESLMKRPVYTHEFPGLADELKAKSKDDFLAVCAGRVPGWGLEERSGDYLSRRELVEWLTRPTGFRANCEDCCEIDCVDCILEECIKTFGSVPPPIVVTGKNG